MIQSVQGELEEAAEQGQSPLLDAPAERTGQSGSAAVAVEAAGQLPPGRGAAMGEAEAVAGDKWQW